MTVLRMKSDWSSSDLDHGNKRISVANRHMCYEKRLWLAIESMSTPQTSRGSIVVFR